MLLLKRKFMKKAKKSIPSAKIVVVGAWIEKSSHDLSSAKILASGNDPILDTAIYHCQQAAEKALKGFLTFHDKRFEKTHDIGELIGECEKINPEFSKWIHLGDMLTPCAWEYRYPGVTSDPSENEFDEAYKIADQLYKFTLRLLPKVIWPKTKKGATK